jgi:hypothetical protein
MYSGGYPFARNRYRRDENSVLTSVSDGAQDQPGLN